MRVHDVTTRQEWEAANYLDRQTVGQAAAETFYERWSASNQRLREWLQANSFHVERDD